MDEDEVAKFFSLGNNHRLTRVSSGTSKSYPSLYLDSKPLFLGIFCKAGRVSNVNPTSINPP